VANPIVCAELRDTTYRLLEKHRQAILAVAQTDLTQIADLTRSMRMIEQQRQQFIQMHGDAFGLDASN